MSAAGAWKGLHGDPPSLPHAPLYAIARLPSAPDAKWFVAGDVGVFRTDDGGDHWANATAPLGLPNTLVRDLRLSADGNTLYAGTFGRSVWSMDVNPPADHFGLRGTVTQAGRPVKEAPVQASGSGRIMRFLKNKITSGTTVTTAPIEVTEIAALSRATASVVATRALSASLVTPRGTELPMIRVNSATNEFSLPAASANSLVGQSITGPWSFKLTGSFLINPLTGATTRLAPSVASGFVSLEFLNVSMRTGPDGAFTLEYLIRGPHLVQAALPNSQTLSPIISIGDLRENTTGIDFQMPSTGDFAVSPTGARIGVHKPIALAFSWTIPAPQNWHDLRDLQLRIRPEDDTDVDDLQGRGKHGRRGEHGRGRDKDAADAILWLKFDEISSTFSLFHEAAKRFGPPAVAGSNKRLETRFAALDVAQTRIVASGPTSPTVTLVLVLSFKPSAAGGAYVVEVAATNDNGIVDDFARAATLTVTR